MYSRRESVLMERYFSKIGMFPSPHNLTMGNTKAALEVFMAKFYKDKPLKNTHEFPAWVRPLQVGAELTKKQVADFFDGTGNNISSKNINYCELNK